jgi:hypothetical protein
MYISFGERSGDKAVDKLKFKNKKITIKTQQADHIK